MRRLLACLGLAASLLACAGPKLDMRAGRAGAPATYACSVGPGGVRLADDRGIGGTGISPNPPPIPVETRDRGVGGTGIHPHEGEQPPAMDLATRTAGVLGAITGFGSICVNGVEIRTAEMLAVHGGDGRLASGALRAGLVVAVTVSATQDKALLARDIAVVHEVSGPVEAVARDRGQLVVAGQTVVRTAATWGVTGPKPGDWVAVSGLRDEVGRIVATRIDPRPPGGVIVHGMLSDTQAGPAIGRLVIGLRDRASALLDRLVVVRGHYQGGVLRVDDIEPDILASAPDDYFGQAAETLSIESYVTVSAGLVSFGSGFRAALLPNSARGAGAGPVVVTLQRQGGGVVAIGLHAAPSPGSRPPAGGGLLPGRGGGPGGAGGGMVPPMPNFGTPNMAPGGNLSGPPGGSFHGH